MNAKIRLTLRRRKRLILTLLGVGTFYVLALAGTFSVVWQNAALDFLGR